MSARPYRKKTTATSEFVCNTQRQMPHLVPSQWAFGAKKIYRRQCDVQSTLVISKSKGPAEKLRDIRTSTYQMCRTEENTKRTTKFHK